MFVDGHERPDVVEDRERFLKTMEELKPYMVDFNEDGTMKDKEYPLDCAVGGGIRRPIIVITHDECTFSANDSIRKAEGGSAITAGGSPIMAGGSPITAGGFSIRTLIII